MEQLNLVHLRGNVGSVRTSPLAEGRSVSNIAVATNAFTRNQGGTATLETQWTNCVMWSNKKFPSPDQITVGIPVEVKGRLRSHHFTGADGMERYNTEVVVTEIVLLPVGEKLVPPLI